ncbi:MAG: histidinol dehydrogenase [Lentisphaerae bacterium]|jgi:histidinol dehydrogenase|nr:histidinol dehydrogenase [Lentisphaerota bacterium]
MKTIFQDNPNFNNEIKPLLNRSAFDPIIDKAVAEILKNVKEKGDEAIVEYALKFDKVHLTPDTFRVNLDNIPEINQVTLDAIKTAVKNITDFSTQKIPKNWTFSPRPGVILGEKFAPLDRVGCYIPGGTAPLISTVVHTVGIAKAAGVKEIVVVTPPGKDGKVNPAVLNACKIAGATEVYQLGGVYAVAALGFGTQTIKEVEKIVGPGNAYVTAAKRQLYGEVALDLVAGPSEIMVLADGTANPAFIAADILSQAEHGSGHEQAVLITTDKALIPKVEAEIKAQAAKLSRTECVQKVLDNGVFLIQVDSRSKVAELASLYAPEHLEVMMDNPQEIVDAITAAGAIFIGPWTPEPVGDFTAGPSHVLPTGGAGRFFSGLTVETFFRRISIVNYQKDALLKELPAIMAFAKNEGLDAHGRSAEIRSEF